MSAKGLIGQFCVFVQVQFRDPGSALMADASSKTWAAPARIPPNVSVTWLVDPTTEVGTLPDADTAGAPTPHGLLKIPGVDNFSRKTSRAFATRDRSRLIWEYLFAVHEVHLRCDWIGIADPDTFINLRLLNELGVGGRAQSTCAGPTWPR